MTPRCEIKILLIHGGAKGFVRREKEILEARFRLRTVQVAGWGLWQVPALISAVWGCDIVLSVFAGRHALLPVFLAKVFCKKIVIEAVGWDVVNLPAIRYGAMRPGPKRWVVRAMLRTADKIICVSQANRHEAIANGLVPGDKIVSIPWGFPASGFSGEKKGASVCTVGEVSWSNLKRKGLETFVRSAAFLPEASFDLIGAWADDSIGHLRSIAGPNVRFTGSLNNKELEQALERTQVYVQVSYHEAFGCAVAEAMSVGSIPVVTKRFALPEVVGGTGFYVPFNDPRATAKAIRQAMKARAKDREAARKRVRDLFSLRKRQELLCAMLVSLHGSNLVKETRQT